MRRIFNSLFFFFCLFGLNTLTAQVSVKFSTADAEITDWSYSISPALENLKSGDQFTVTFKGHVKEEGWHLYSSQEAPAGMGYNSTKFEFYPKESKGIQTVGKLKEQSKPYSMWDDIMRDSVRFFKGHDVSFKQSFKTTGDAFTLIGELSYQICVDPEGGGQCRFLSLPFEITAKAKSDSPSENPIEPESDTGNATPVSPSNSGDCCNCLGNYRVDKQGNLVRINEVINDSSLVGSNLPLIDKIQKQKKQREEKGQIVVAGDASTLVKKEGGGCGDVSLWVMFLTSFLFGFAAVLTPCVFPMIPLTVSFFTKQSGTRAKGLRNAILYGLFIIFIYSGLGITVSIAFGEDFLYNMSTNPWVNLGFFILLFVFALSFLGMFEITLPASWVNKIDKQSDRGGIIGIFFMALTLALVSFSCTGPLVGTALMEAAGGCIWGPIVSMVGFSSALAIPFMVFAIFPGWMNSLPKSGGWLNSVKVVLGFLELALGLKFLSQTDLYLKWHILDREVFLAAWIVIFAIIGIYLLGKIRLPHDSPTEKLSVPRALLALFSFWFVLYLVPGLWGAKLPFVSGILPPPNPEIGVKILGQKEMNVGTLNGEICSLDFRKYYDIFEVKEHSGFCTFYDLDEGLQFARKMNMPVLLDFTGHTCANCRQMEQEVWSKPEIGKMLKENFVMISLYADEDTDLLTPEEIGGVKVRTIGKKNVQIQKALFKTLAQPYYAIVDSDLNNMVAPRGFNKDLGEYKAFMETGIAQYKKMNGGAKE